MSDSTHQSRPLLGYLFALCAGVLWGTTGPLSTALYSEGAELTDVGFWRITLALAGFVLYGLFRPALFQIDRNGLLLVALVGGSMVAMFEVGFQYAIAGVGIAGAATLLYTAPVMVAVLAWLLLSERLTALRIVLAIVTMVGVALTVTGQVSGDAPAASSRSVGILGGLLAAVAYTGTTLVARWAVPRYGAVRVLFFELAGGSTVLALILPLTGHTPSPPDSTAAWIYIAALGLGAVLTANFFFFAGVRRIDAAPASVAASVEPVVGAILALLLFGQALTPLGWLGLALVVGSVSLSYLRESRPEPPTAPVASGSFAA